VASIDWSRARAIAAGLDALHDPALVGLVGVLAQYPSQRDLVLALRTRHLLGEPRIPSADAITVPAVMASFGRGWLFGAHVTRVLDHASLARHLARLGGLDDVVVEEVPTHDVIPGARLRASSHGEIFATPATVEVEDFYDLDAIAGLLNVIARVRGANVRYLVVQDPLAYEAIVLGPPAELASALAEGLLETPRDDAQIEPDLPF
jgi:hypothetical protein